MLLTFLFRVLYFICSLSCLTFCTSVWSLSRLPFYFSGWAFYLNGQYLALQVFYFNSSHSPLKGLYFVLLRFLSLWPVFGIAGTLLSIPLCLCCPTRHSHICKAILFNLLAGLLQVLLFLLIVGWIWSILWGMNMVTLACELSLQKMERKKEN